MKGRQSASTKPLFDAPRHSRMCAIQLLARELPRSSRCGMYLWLPNGFARLFRTIATSKPRFVRPSNCFGIADLSRLSDRVVIGIRKLAADSVGSAFNFSGPPAANVVDRSEGVFWTLVDCKPCGGVPIHDDLKTVAACRIAALLPLHACPMPRLAPVIRLAAFAIATQHRSRHRRIRKLGAPRPPSSRRTPCRIPVS